MKNEALERLWRMLNIADIEGKGASQYAVEVWLEEVKNAIEETEAPEKDPDTVYEEGYNDGYDAGYEAAVSESMEGGC